MLTISLAVLASVIQIFGHILYNKEETSIPNLTSWTIWGVTSMIDMFNYSEMTGDWQKNLLIVTCSLASMITWVICISKGRFRKPRISDYVSFTISIIALILWKQFNFLTESNLLLQVDNLISFIPIIAMVALRPTSETPSPWIWWTVSYVIGTAVVILRYQQWQDLVYPVSCAVLHLTVGLLALRIPTKKHPVVVH